MKNLPDPFPAHSEEAAVYLSRYVLPLGIKTNEADLPWEKMNRGCFSLINTGERDVFVTCHHVLEHYENLLSENENAEIVAYAQNAPVLIELYGFSIKDKNRDPLDMAIFVGSEDSAQIPGSQFFELRRPGPVLKEGDPILVVGYPAVNVSVSNTFAEFGIMQFLVRASSVSDQRIVLANEFGDRIYNDFCDPPRSREEVPLGALSGCPAFHIGEDGEYSLVGIVTDGEHESGTILISRIDCLLPDGTIDQLRI